MTRKEKNAILFLFSKRATAGTALTRKWLDFSLPQWERDRANEERMAMYHYMSETQEMLGILGYKIIFADNDYGYEIVKI